MKRLLLTIFLAAFIMPGIFAQDFDVDRLPVGDINKKYDFCTVKLDKIFDTDNNRESSFDEMINELKQKRIILIGETHTNQLHHDLQYEIIKGLTEAGKPIVLALEMYNPEQNEALAAWVSGETDPETFLEQTDYLTTWSHNYRYYQSIFEYVREKHIPVYGVNVDRKYASKIGMGGLGSLTEEDKEVLPEIDTSNIEHKFLIKVLMQGVDATSPKQFNNLYPAQSLWDAAMGEGAIEAAQNNPDAVVIVLAGSGHVVYNLGIGRIIEDRSDLSFASVVPVDITEKVKEPFKMPTGEMPKDKSKVTADDKKPATDSPHSMGMNTNSTPYRIVIKSYANFLAGKKEVKEEKYPSFGFSLKDAEGGGYLVDRVLPETVAYENGLKKGDIIQAVDGKTFENLFELKKYLHFKSWNEEISFNLKRDDEDKYISFIITPVKTED